MRFFWFLLTFLLAKTPLLPSMGPGAPPPPPPPIPSNPPTQRTRARASASAGRLAGTFGTALRCNISRDCATRTVAPRGRPRRAARGSRSVCCCAAALPSVARLRRCSSALLLQQRNSTVLHICNSARAHRAHICTRTLGSPRQHLHRDWAHPTHIYTGTCGPSVPHLHRDWAHPAHICAGTAC